MNDKEAPLPAAWSVTSSKSKRGRYRFQIRNPQGTIVAVEPVNLAHPTAEEAEAIGNAALRSGFDKGYNEGRELERGIQAEELARVRADKASLKADLETRTSEHDQADANRRSLGETLADRNTLLNRAKDRIEVLERDLRHARQHRWFALAAGVILGAAAYAAVLRYGADYLPLF